MQDRENKIKEIRDHIKSLEKELKRFSRDNLTVTEYTAIVEIRESCNRIIEEEIAR